MHMYTAPPVAHARPSKVRLIFGVPFVPDQVTLVKQRVKLVDIWDKSEKSISTLPIEICFLSSAKWSAALCNGSFN